MSSEKIFHLVGSESGAMCGLYKGAGPAYHCQMRELGGFGQVLGKRTNAKHLLQGRNASFGVDAKRARQIFLQMDLFGWDTNAHLATEEEKNMQPLFHTIWIWSGFSKRHLQAGFVENVWLQW